MMEINEEWVMSRHNKNHGLKPIQTILNKAGNPQNKIRIIHVAGTNGKGSTCNYLKDILISQGFKVGMFTSPHLVNHRDRIRINDAWIPHDVFMKYLKQYYEDIVSLDLGMFEIDTLITYTWFYEEQVDYAIIECGLGGRLDSTNVIEKPVLSVITTIAKDHMQILGNRIEQIAFEKAGIIMPYGTCAVGMIDDKALPVIEKHAWRMHASVKKMPVYRNPGKGTFSFMHDTYALSSLAEYQKQNASLALWCGWLLGIDIHSDTVKHAVCQSMWAGRFEKISDHPDVYVDGAHNEEGIEALTLSARCLKHPLITVFSALKDKPGMKMAERLQEISDVLIVTSFHNARADTLEDLSPEGAIKEPSYEKAIEKALSLAEDKGTVLICGSLYFVSIVREMFRKKTGIL